MLKNNLFSPNPTVISGFLPEVHSYGFNGQEEDNELWAGGVTFKYRVEDARLGRFFSVDPLGDDYPFNSLYAFCENRVIDGKEREGLEWEEVKNDYGNVIAIQVTINLHMTNIPKGFTAEDYKIAIQAQFNKTISKSSNGWLNGIVKFDNSVSEESTGRIVPRVHLTGQESKCFGPYEIAGFTSFEGVSMNLYASDGSMVPITEIAKTTTHELLHTLKIGHPFEEDYVSDDDILFDGGTNYRTFNDTHPNAKNNIMMYEFQKIDGELPDEDKRDLLTPGQFDRVISEVNNQMKGAGVRANKIEYYLPEE